MPLYYIKVFCLLFLSIHCVDYAKAQELTYIGIPDSQFDYNAASQKSKQWCWAASIQMILNYYGVDINQEQVVARSYGIDENGNLPDWPASFNLITENLNGWEIDSNGRQHLLHAVMGYGPPAPADLINELSNGKPVIVAYRSGPGSSHAVVITGLSYIDSPDGPLVRSITVRDPWPDDHDLKFLGKLDYSAKSLAQQVEAFWFISLDE